MDKNQTVFEEMRSLRAYVFWGAVVTAVICAVTYYVLYWYRVEEAQHFDFIRRCEQNGGKIQFVMERQSKGNYRQETYCIRRGDR